jgi:hypothetical protein
VRIDGVCDEPVTMGFNGMMSEDVAEVLARYLAESDQYLEAIARVPTGASLENIGPACAERMSTRPP